MPLLRFLAALLLLGSAAARADSLISGLPAVAVPLAAGTCLVIDQTGTTGKLCSNYPAALGALAVSNNLSDLGNPATARVNLGLAPIANSGSASDLATGTVPSGRLSLGTASAPGIVQCDGTSITCTAGVIAAVGGGGSTTVTAGPGLGNSQSLFNGTGAAQTVTNGSMLYPQLGSVAKTAGYKINADCSAGVLCDTARLLLADGTGSIAFTAPNPAGTLAPYQIADEAGHGFTVPTVGGTDHFAGCVGGSPTTLTVPANYSVQLFDQGTGNGYFCVLQPEQQIVGASGANPTAVASNVATNGSAATFMRSDASPAVQLGSATQPGLLECGSGTSCTSGTISVSGGGGAPGETSGYQTGGAYGEWPGNYSVATGSPNTGFIYCTKLTIFKEVHIDSLSVNVTTASAGTNIALALYNSGANGLPGTVAANTGSVSAAAAGVATGSFTSTDFPAGNYWVCAQVSSASPAFVENQTGQFESGSAALVGSDSIADYFSFMQTPTSQFGFLTFVEATFGTWPNLSSLYVASQVVSGMPAIVWHAASVP